jgi:hypothetical protein
VPEIRSLLYTVNSLVLTALINLAFNSSLGDGIDITPYIYGNPDAPEEVEWLVKPRSVGRRHIRTRHIEIGAREHGTARDALRRRLDPTYVAASSLSRRNVEPVRRRRQVRHIQLDAETPRPLR